MFRCQMTLLLVGLMCFSWNVYADKPVILTTIQPLALITKDIAGDDANVSVLLDGTASPHHFTLRFSDLKRIDSAELVVWGGPQLEPFLVKAVAAKKTLTMATLPGLYEADHDPHYWLSKHNAILLAAEVKNTMSSWRPDAREKYEARFQAFVRELNSVNVIGSEQSPGFISFHASLTYFIEDFDLDQLGVLTHVPEERVGAKTLMRVMAEAKSAKCLLAEWGEGAEAAPYASRMKLPMVKIDVLAVAKNYESYQDYLSSLLASVTACK